MSFGTVVVILAGIIALVIITRTKHAARRDNCRETFGGDPALAQREAELRREVEELRERIQVLERIATDSAETARLSAEIEKLRDK